MVRLISSGSVRRSVPALQHADVVRPLRHPELFVSRLLSPPKGILLYGRPGAALVVPGTMCLTPFVHWLKCWNTERTSGPTRVRHHRSLHPAQCALLLGFLTTGAWIANRRFGRGPTAWDCALAACILSNAV